MNCSYVENMRTHVTKDNAVILNDIQIQKDYCFSVSASTSIGSSDFTNDSLIPGEHSVLYMINTMYAQC